MYVPSPVRVKLYTPARSCEVFMLWPGARTVKLESLPTATTLEGAYLTLMPVKTGGPEAEEMLKVLVLALESTVRGSFSI